jgi:predicted permease
MSNIIMLFLCLLIGMGLRASGRVPDNAHLGINAFIIHVSLPALILLHIHGIRFDSGLVYPVAMPWLLFGLSAGLVWCLGEAIRLTPLTTGALILTTGLANTSFVGLPVIETFYGAAIRRSAS